MDIVEFGEQAVFWLMGFASVIAVAVGVERTLVFFRSVKNDSVIIPELITSFRKKEISGLTAIEAREPRSVYARFASFAAEHYNSGTESLNELLSGKMITERIELEKRLPILSTLGNNAPFLGLLGTVLGVIKAFKSLGSLGSSGAEVVMQSISVALLATAAGLFVAIPVVMVNNYFSKKLKVISQNLDILSKEILASTMSKG
ncbi:MAG: MotA/TolQ/ExbB proton channel family protein [Leptospiraceae bacterium]|nr:MotA/TolQ/ExbB proton channel family protein [Leptospiraceae bacterium]